MPLGAGRAPAPIQAAKETTNDRFNQDSRPRQIVAVTRGEATSDGAGVKMTRLIGSRAQPPLDPFLMLDFFGSDEAGDYIGGFPDHPHRGFETVTYMLAGRMRHRDNHGHSGVIAAGDVQWMKAGTRPDPFRNARAGPRPDARLPAVDQSAGRRENVRAGLSGNPRGGKFRWKSASGASRKGHRRDQRRRRHRARCARRHVDARYFDIELAPGGRFVERLPPDHAAFFVVYEGAATAGATAIDALSLVDARRGGERRADRRARGRARAAARRPAAGRAGGLERAFRHEHPRRIDAGLRGLPAGKTLTGAVRSGVSPLSRRASGSPTASL